MSRSIVRLINMFLAVLLLLSGMPTIEHGHAHDGGNRLTVTRSIDIRRKEKFVTNMVMNSSTIRIIGMITTNRTAHGTMPNPPMKQNLQTGYDRKITETAIFTTV